MATGQRAPCVIVAEPAQNQPPVLGLIQNIRCASPPGQVDERTEGIVAGEVGLARVGREPTRRVILPTCHIVGGLANIEI